MIICVMGVCGVYVCMMCFYFFVFAMLDAGTYVVPQSRTFETFHVA